VDWEWCERNSVRLRQRFWSHRSCFPSCPAWLTPHSMSSEIRKIESIHYRCLRLIIKDYRQRVPGEWVTASTQRLTTKQWGKFAAASLAMKIHQTGVPERIHPQQETRSTFWVRLVKDCSWKSNVKELDRIYPWKHKIRMDWLTFE